MSNLVTQHQFTWDWFELVLREFCLPLYQSLNPPATAEQVKRAEDSVGIKFPEFVRQSYLRHNGCDGSIGLFTNSYTWVSLETMVSTWGQLACTWAAQQNSDDYDQPKPSKSWAKYVARPLVWWESSRIPLGLSNTSACLYLDMHPGPAGVRGQLLQSEPEVVLGTSLEEYLLELGNQLVSGALRISNDSSGSELVYVDGSPAFALANIRTTPKTPIHTSSNFSWDWFEAVLEEYYPAMYKALRKPATRAQIEKTHAITSYYLPEFVQKAYLRHNGASENAPFFLPDFSWCSLEQMAVKWMSLKDFSEARAIENFTFYYPDRKAEWEMLAVEPVLWKLTRFPIGVSNSGAIVHIDLDAGPTGCSGQVVRDDLTMHQVPLATSLEA